MNVARSAGAEIVTAGGPSATVIALSVLVALPPCPSATVTLGVYVPGAAYVCDGLATAACVEPSPKSQL